MSNFVFYDFETTSSNKQWGQIIEVGAILVDDQLNELDRFDSRCRLAPGIIPEAMSLIVSNTSPKKLKETNLSHYEMVNQFVKKLKSPISLEKIKKNKKISHLPLIKQSRLSVMPIDYKSWKIIYNMGKV